MGFLDLSCAFVRRLLTSVIWRYLFMCQAGWFVCVLGAARGVGWLGVVFALCMVGYHLARAAQPWREARLVVVTIVIGWIWESILMRAGLLAYPNGTLIAGTAPYWMAGLWALFAVQFNVVFVWLRSRLLLAAALGAVGGPLSFRAGAALGAVHFQNPGKALAALAFGWSILLPACLSLAGRWDGIHNNE